MKVKKIIFLVMALIACTINVSCKKEVPATPTVNLPPPSPPIPSGVAGFWSEDPYYSGDAYGYYPAGFVNISIDGGALIKLYYVLPPTGPPDCYATGVMNIRLSIGQHSWQVFNVNTNTLVRSGTFTITSQLCQLVKIL
jgi:hypothetical protein